MSMRIATFLLLYDTLHTVAERGVCLAADDEASYAVKRSLIQWTRTHERPGASKSRRHSPLDAPVNHLAAGSDRSQKTLQWTTNIGQPAQQCNGSVFNANFHGSINGLVVSSPAVRLKKGSCKGYSNFTIPKYTQALTCEDMATGCHMWCSPVWTSHYDMTQWSAMDSRCSNWDGSFNHQDLRICNGTNRVFTWARTEAPMQKNRLELSFAIVDGCTYNFCSPLWITIYDDRNWAKSHRWCFNTQGAWGACDKYENVTVMHWHPRTFSFEDFYQKHGYRANTYQVELAVYAEYEMAEVLVHDVKFKHVAPPVTTTNQVISMNDVNCGQFYTCGAGEKCCRKAGGYPNDARCCPISWNCCQDTCCPSFHNCTISADGCHECSAYTSQHQEYSTHPNSCFHEISSLSTRHNISNSTRCKDLCTDDPNCYGSSYIQNGSLIHTCHLTKILANPILRTPCTNNLGHQLQSVAFKKEMRKPNVCYITR